jgi:hypothetical protein
MFTSIAIFSLVMNTSLRWFLLKYLLNWVSLKTWNTVTVMIFFGFTIFVCRYSSFGRFL